MNSMTIAAICILSVASLIATAGALPSAPSENDLVEINEDDRTIILMLMCSGCPSTMKGQCCNRLRRCCAPPKPATSGTTAGTTATGPAAATTAGTGPTAATTAGTGPAAATTAGTGPDAVTTAGTGPSAETTAASATTG